MAVMGGQVEKIDLVVVWVTGGYERIGSDGVHTGPRNVLCKDSPGYESSSTRVLAPKFAALHVRNAILLLK